MCGHCHLQLPSACYLAAVAVAVAVAAAVAVVEGFDPDLTNARGRAS